MQRTEIVALCDRYVAAVASKDADQIMDLFAEDAHQYEPITASPNIGQAAIRAFFTSYPTVRLKLSRIGPITVVGRHAAMQLRVESERDGVNAVFTTTDLIEFNENGQIQVIQALPDRAADPDSR